MSYPSYITFLAAVFHVGLGDMEKNQYHINHGVFFLSIDIYDDIISQTWNRVLLSDCPVMLNKDCRQTIQSCEEWEELRYCTAAFCAGGEKGHL